MKILKKWLEENSSKERYLFSLHDLHSLYPEMSINTFKTLISRSVRAGFLIRVCRGMFLYKKEVQSHELILFHIASRLRSNAFNYISLETVLSNAGIISQIPINWISIMSSGRSSIIQCGLFGTIEFIHTTQRPSKILEQIYYDHNCKMWCASILLALRDMKTTHRNCDLIDWSLANELV